MFKKFSLAIIAFMLLVLPGCSSAQPSTSSPSAAPPTKSTEKVELTVSAAASLTDALKELKTSFEQEHPDISLSYNFGSSGMLAQQIGQGAPADVFLSASKKDMDTLQSKNEIVKDSRVTFAKNELVLIANINSPLTIPSFDKINPDQIKQLAIGEPQNVPAGRYAQETFQKLNLWNKIQSKVVLGKDVRQVLTYVESGNADLGVVYASDALISKKVKVLATAKPEWHKPIVYPAAIVSDSPHKDAAMKFIAYLLSEKEKDVLKKYGFK